MVLRALLLLAALFAFSATPALAAIYCVSTAVNLNSAFAAANNGDEGSVQDIRVRPGTYNVPNGLEFNPAGNKDAKNFSLTGGWNSDCSARTINAQATVLNADNGNNDGGFKFFGNNTHYVIEGIRFINFSGFHLDDDNCGFDCPDTVLIRFRYNELRNGQGTLGGGANVYIRAKDAASLNVSNNLFANFSPGGGAAVRIDYNNDETTPIIAFNTIAKVFCSSTSGDALVLYTRRSGLVLHHNLVQSTGCGGDIHVLSGGGAQPVAFRNNLYSGLEGLTPALVANNVINGNVDMFVDFNNNDYRLRESGPVSVAINAGLTPENAQALGLAAGIPSQDLDGPAGQRLIGTRYDIGAYESSINNSSVLTVTKTADTNDGVCNADCSLREAITVANASAGLQTIKFNIPGGCTPTPHLITLTSLLPDITDSVEIDGYSEPESAANSQDIGSDAVLCIVLTPQASILAQALQVPVGAPAATRLTVKGIAFGAGFATFTVGVRLRGGSNHVIQGNAFGGIGPGSIGSLGSLNFGLQIRDEAQNVLVGGDGPEHRNSFGATSSSAIVLNDASSGGHRIQNNYIGLSASGITASPIGLNGIFASNSPNVEILDNVIAAVANQPAIAIQGATATGYTIQGNRLGMSAFSVPTAAFRNKVGIQIAAGSGDHLIGTLTGTTQSNTIVNSEEAGVWITSTAGTGTLVRPNRIHSNGQGGSGLGVDIGPLGPSVNDPLDPDGGANNGQNWPQVIASLPNADGTRQVGVILDSNPNSAFRIDVYRAPVCPGGSRGGDMLNRIGSVTVNSNAQGIATVNLPMSGGGAPGVLVAQATRVGTRDSSEPGNCFLEPIATTTTIVNDTPDPSMVGQSYQVSVLVSAASGTATGQVNISDGDGNQCNATLSGGTGSCNLPSTSVGNKTLTASYPGSATHAPSNGSAAHQVVPATTTTTITSDAPDPSEVGQPYTVVVQVRTPAGNTATPGGQVSVSDGSGQTCQISSLNNGDGSCQLTSVSVGNKTLTASYAGAVNFVASNDTEPHTVVAIATTTTITSDAPDPSQVGQNYTVVVQVNSVSSSLIPTGTVAVTDGSGANCNITLASGSGSCQLASTSVGSKTLIANYVPNSQAYAASSDTEEHTVVAAGPAATTTQITGDTPDPSKVGEPYTVSVSVNSAAGTPTGNFQVNGGINGGSCQGPLVNGSGQCQLTSMAAGSILLTACMQANANFAGSCGTAPHAVTKASTEIQSVQFTPGAGTVGQSVSVQIALAVQAPGSGTPTGNVQVAISAAEQCTIALPATSCQLPLTTAGTRLVSVDYLGDSNYFPSNREVELTVVPMNDNLFANGFE